MREKLIYSLSGLTCFLVLLPISIYFIENGADSFDTTCIIESSYEMVKWTNPYGSNRYFLINISYVVNNITYQGRLKSWDLIHSVEVECYGTVTDEFLYWGHISLSSYLVGSVIILVEIIIVFLIVTNLTRKDVITIID